MGEVWRLTLPSTEKLVLLALADSASDEGICWPSLAELAMKTGLSTRAVQHCLRRFSEAAAVTTQQRYKQSSVYRIDVQRLGAISCHERRSPEPHSPQGSSGARGSPESPSGECGAPSGVQEVHPLKTSDSSSFQRFEPSKRNREDAHARAYEGTRGVVDFGRNLMRNASEIMSATLDAWRDIRGVNAVAFARWITIAEERGKVLDTNARLALAKWLAGQGDDAKQAAIIEQSERGGWKNLRPLETNTGKPAKERWHPPDWQPPEKSEAK